MHHLDLTDEQTDALVRELSSTIDNDRFPLSPRIAVLRSILDQLRPESAKAPPPPPRGTKSHHHGADTRDAVNVLVTTLRHQPSTTTDSVRYLQRAEYA
jgi:hypothetical protein